MLSPPISPSETQAGNRMQESRYGYPTHDSSYKFDGYPDGPPSIKTVDRNHEHVKQYRNDFGNLLSWANSAQFSIVGVEMFLFAKDSKMPYEHSVLFTLSSRKSSEDDTVAARKEFQKSFPRYNIPVAFLLGEMSRSAKVQIGDCLGVSNINWTRGSIGGIVLVNGQRLLLTCRHVTHFQDKYIPDFVQHGYMSSPSLMTRNERIKKIQEEIDEEIVGKDNYLETCRSLGTTPSRVEMFDQTIQDLQEDLEELRAVDASISNVAYTTPIHKTSVRGRSRTFDWSLVSLDLPVRFNEVNTIQARCTLTHKNLRNQDNVEITRTIPLEDLPYNSYVFKRGAITKIREGYLQNLDNGIDMDGSGVMTWEFVVVNHEPDVEFSAKGDSGSWVMNRDGDLCGVVIGGQHGHICRRSYVADITNVFDDIERITGHRPTLPQSPS